MDDATRRIAQDEKKADSKACQNCETASVSGFELSRLVWRDGELHETQVVAVFVLCVECLHSLAGLDWEDLLRRRIPAVEEGRTFAPANRLPRTL